MKDYLFCSNIPKSSLTQMHTHSHKLNTDFP